MKLFREVGIKQGKTLYGVHPVTGEKSELKTMDKMVMEIVPETEEYLLNGSGGHTLDRIRYLIANLYNYERFPEAELFSLMRNADEEHQELVLDIIGICQHKYGQSCFTMINEFAPRIVEKFAHTWNEE